MKIGGKKMCSHQRLAANEMWNRMRWTQWVEKKRWILKSVLSQHVRWLQRFIDQNRCVSISESERVSEESMHSIHCIAEKEKKRFFLSCYGNVYSGSVAHSHSHTHFVTRWFDVNNVIHLTDMSAVKLSQSTSKTKYIFSQPIFHCLRFCVQSEEKTQNVNEDSSW